MTLFVPQLDTLGVGPIRESECGLFDSSLKQYHIMGKKRLDVPDYGDLPPNLVARICTIKTL